MSEINAVNGARTRHVRLRIVLIRENLFFTQLSQSTVPQDVHRYISLRPAKKPASLPQNWQGNVAMVSPVVNVAERQP